MADEFRTFAITIPAGTAIASAISTAMPMPFDRWVEAVEFRIPSGVNGVVGFALQSAHQQVVPAVVGTWVVTNDEILAWEFSDVLKDGDWQFLGYNTGTYPHTIQVRFRLVLPTVVQPPLMPIPASSLSGVA